MGIVFKNMQTFDKHLINDFVEAKATS